MAKTSTISHTSAIERQPQRVKPKRAAIYIRCSSDEAKKEGYSPETQEEKLKEFVKTNGWQLDEKYIYKDIGYSGGTDKRPEFQRLLKDARNKEFDVVLVFRQDRFFRNLRLLLNTVMGELKELGIEFKSITEPFDTTTPTGRAMFGNAGVFAEWQREIGLEAREEGVLKAAKAGKWIAGGIKPFGYKFNPDTQKLEINKKESKVVKMIFDWLVSEKLTLYRIQQKLNEMKIPTKYDNLKKEKPLNSKNWWQYRTVERITKNEIYVGEYYWRKYKNSARVHSNKNLRPKDDWISVSVPAIISREAFEKAQKQIVINKELAWRRTKRVYIFQHKLICGLDKRRYLCGFWPPKSPTQKGGNFYTCSGTKKGKKAVRCTARSIVERKLLSPIWDSLKSLLLNPTEILSYLKEYSEDKTKENNFQDKINGIEKKLEFLKKKEERLAKLFSENLIDIDVYQKQWNECKAEASKQKEEKDRLSQFLMSKEDKQTKIDSIKDLYQRLKDRLENATYETKYQIIRKLIEKVIITGINLEIECNLPYRENVPNFIDNKGGEIEEKTSDQKFCADSGRILRGN